MPFSITTGSAPVTAVTWDVCARTSARFTTEIVSGSRPLRHDWKRRSIRARDRALASSQEMATPESTTPRCTSARLSPAVFPASLVQLLDEISTGAGCPGAHAVPHLLDHAGVLLHWGQDELPRAPGPDRESLTGFEPQGTAQVGRNHNLPFRAQTGYDRAPRHEVCLQRLTMTLKHEERDVVRALRRACIASPRGASLPATKGEQAE